MKPKTKRLLKLGLWTVGLYYFTTSMKETIERHQYWQMARTYCDEVGKPLLRVGLRRNITEPPNGDVTLDIDPEVLTIEGGVLGDERDMPFNSNQFGVCFNEHTLEHLYTPDDVQAAISECIRVADYAVLLVPGPYTLGGYFHPDHKLRIWFEDNQISVQQIPYIEGWQNMTFPGLNRIGQALILYDETPEVTERAK